MIPPLILLFTLGHIAVAKLVQYDWNISWVTAAPDGFHRPVIGINGQWPCPQIDVDVGDRVVVNMYNGLGNQSTSLHWHGLHQNGTMEMDGASAVSQCPVAPGQSFKYDFLASQTGTYWYHSHDMGQYPDGLWGPLIIHDPNPPFHFDEEITITLSDWYHEQMPDLIYTYQSPQGEAEDGTPAPSGGALFNSQKDAKIHVKPNTTYLIHIICPGNYPGHGWVFDQHPMTTVEIDGIYIEPVDANSRGLQVRIAPGQRQAVLITTKNDTSTNYGILDLMDVNMLFINKGIIPPPSDYDTNVTAWLVYNDSAPFPPAPVLHKLGNEYFIDDLDYIPLDHEPIWGPVDHQIIIETRAANISGISRFTVNNSTYFMPQVPTLYSALTVSKDYSSNPTVYGHVNPIVVKHNDIVEVVINNRDSNLHPWHLHGHSFQVLERTLPNTGAWPGYYSNHSATPVRRDTLMLQDDAWAVIRFRADNPEFHTVSGFVAMIIEAPELLSGREDLIPDNHLEVCNAYPMKTEGNAVGNVDHPLDLTGQVTAPNSNDHGAMYPPAHSELPTPTPVPSCK